MKSFIFALRFLTVIPLSFKHITEKQTISGSLIYFPLVGLLIGFFLVILDILLSEIFPSNLVAMIVILFLVLLTGGLHLDGLADSADGFYAGRDRESILRIMRDSHIGTMGVLALIMVIMLKIGFLNVLNDDLRRKALYIMPVISRWTMVLVISLFSYARSAGKAESFFEDKNNIKLCVSTIILLIILYVFFGFMSFIILVPIMLLSLLFAIFVNKKLSGVTGDTLGALNEINELLVLILVMLVGTVL